VHVKKNFVRRVAGNAGGVFVADVELNARIGRRNEIAFDLELRLFSERRRGQQDEAEPGQQDQSLRQGARDLFSHHCMLL
jgi:hypothetical protein